MKKTIKYLQDGEYHYATVKDVGDLEQLKTKHKEDLVTALNELFTTGGDATPTGYDDLVKKVNDTQTTVDGINSTITDVNGKVVANDEAIAQAKKDLQDALAQFQEFNDEIEQAKKDAETELANAKQALKDEFTDNLADAQKANQKQLEDKVSAIQGNLDTTSNTLNDVKTQLTNAKLDYGNVNVSIQKLNDMLATKLSSTDLDPLKTSIQNQETEIQQTKDSIATKAGKAEFDVLSGRVSTAESKIKQQADEISLGVKKSELNGAIDNYQVEGTNRLRDTIDFDIDNGYWKLDQYSINSNTDVHPYDQAHDVSALVLQKTGSAKQDVDFTNEDLGNSFVISVWNKKDAQPQVWYGNTQLANRQVSDIKGDYERSFFTFIPTNVNVKTIMFKYDAGTANQLIIGEPKLELGTKPKAYAPNPNDEHKQIVNTKAELKIASDKIESTVEKQTKTDDNINQLSSRVTQTEQGITATNDLITKTKDGLIKDYTGKIDASAKSLSSEFEEKTDEKIGQITDSGENLILNSAFTNETDRKDKWQNISDKVNIVDDGNGLMWAKMSQSGLTADNPISLTSNYFPIKQGKITVGVDIKSDNTNGLSGAKIVVLQTYNANKQRVDFTEISLENMGLTVQQLADGQSHRGVYRLGNDRSDAVYMTVKAVLPRNGSIYFTNFSAKLSSIDNGGYTPNAEDLKRQILNQKTKIEQNSQQITLKASSTELRDVRTIANGAVSSANDANKTADTALTNANSAVSVANNANTNANSAKSTANNANNNATSAVSVANQANATATQAKNNASNAVNTANSANTTASNAVNTANQANSTANTANSSANQANSKVAAIQANGGGRNLAIGTGAEYTMGYGIPNTTWEDGYAYLKLPATLTYHDIEALPQDPHTFFYNLTPGATYTQTVWLETDATVKDLSVAQITWWTKAGHDFQPATLINLGENRYKLYSTYRWPGKSDNNVRLFDTKNLDNAFDLSTGTYLKFGKLKLEEGTIAHDWQPAPEDIQTQIDQARTDIQSTLTVANNGITAATNLKTTYDNYVQKNDANIKLLGDRITNEVSKITSNGGGRNLAVGTSSNWTTVPDVDEWNLSIIATYPNAQAGDVFTVSVDTQSTKTLTYEIWQGSSQYIRDKFVTGDNLAIASGTTHSHTTFTWPSGATQYLIVQLRNITSDGSHASYKCKNVMLEKGTVAHDWQPAPEDTNSAIEAVSSKIDQTATSITSTVNSTKQDLQGQINSANTKITQTANSITEQLKSYSKTGDMQNYVNTTIQKTADGISAKVSGMETSLANANSKLDSITSNGGGRNLARGTSSDWTDFSGFDNKANYSVSPANIYLDTLQVGDTMTWGITLKNTGITAGTFAIQGSGNVTSWNNGALNGKNYTISNDLPAGTIKTFVLTTVISEAQKKNDYFAIQLRTDNIPKGGTLSYRCVFAEKGIIAHDWQPAPEDTNSAIETTKADLVQQITDAKNAAIKVSKDSITSEVSDVRTTITQVDNKVDNIQIGGRNLLNGTSDVWTTITASGWMNVTTAKSNKTSVADYHTGDKFTYSATVTNKSNTNVRLEMYRCDKNGNRITTGTGFYVNSDLVAPNTTAQRISCTISIDSNTWYVEHTLIADGGTSTSKTVQMKGEMFEVGTTPTAWKPNPHDEFGGGVNLLTGTSDKEWTNTYKSTWTEGLIYTVPPTSGGTYVLSFEAKASNSGNIMQSHWYSGGIAGSVNPVNNYVDSNGVEFENGNSDGVMFTTLTTSWQRYFYLITARASGGNTQIIVGRLNDRAKVGTGSISIRKVKLEKGFYPTDWSPSPQDVATDISNVTTKVEQYKTKIDQNEKAIALKADQTVVDKTNGDVKLLQSELKVQSDKIESKVSQSDYNSAIIQLKNVISLHVSKGNVVSSINEEAGGNTLIRVSDGKGKLLLNAGSVEFSGSAFIPDAAISTINADKLRFYDNSGNVATMSAGLKQYDDDKAKKTIVLEYAGGYEVHASNILGSILTMHDNSIRLAVKAHGDSDMGSKDQYSGFYAMSHYAQLSCYRTDGRAPGIYITDDGYTIKGDYSGNGTKYGDLNITSPQIYVQGGNSVAISGGNAVQMQVNNTHAWLSDSMLHLYKDGDGGSTATQLRVEGWAWINGWVEAAGHSQHSALSTKTDIQSVDDEKMLKMVNDTDLTTFLYKTDIANGETHRHIGLIIDDVHDVAQYQTPQEFIAPNGVSRDDDNMIGALFGAVKALTKRIKTLESKVD